MERRYYARRLLWPILFLATRSFIRREGCPSCGSLVHDAKFDVLSRRNFMIAYEAIK